MVPAHSRFTVHILLNKLMKRQCLGGPIIDNHVHIMLSNEPMLIRGASSPWADEGELAWLACNAPAEPANSEISIIHLVPYKNSHFALFPSFCMNIV